MSHTQEVFDDMLAMLEELQECAYERYKTSLRRMQWKFVIPDDDDMEIPF